MDGPWKRIAHKPSVHRKVFYFIKAMYAPSASHPNKQGASGGSLGAEPTSAHTILFHVEGRLFFVHVLVRSHISEN